LTATVAYTVNITPNSPPTVTGGLKSVGSGQASTLNRADFGYSDPDGDALHRITILNPPTSGTLEYYG
jgi:hypothetical protein